MVDDREIADVLHRVRSIALLGASPRPERPSYGVMRFLLEHGYRVFPVNPGLAGTQLLGQTVYPSLADLPQRVDMVDVFRQSRFLDQIVDDTVASGIGVLWTQLGVVDEVAAQRAQNAGIRVVMDRCPAIEWPRLKAAGLL